MSMSKASNVTLNGILLEATETWVKLGKDTTHTYKETIGANHTWVREGGPEPTMVRFHPMEGSDDAGQLNALRRIQADLRCTMTIDGEEIVLEDGMFEEPRTKEARSWFVASFTQED